jgi:hypothetical protein
LFQLTTAYELWDWKSLELNPMRRRFAKLFIDLSADQRTLRVRN